MSYPVPGSVTPQEAQQAAAEQIGVVGQDLGPGPQASAEDLGVAAMAAGAQPGEVDAGALLRQIQALQGRLEVLEQEKRADQAPAVVIYGQALADHVIAKVNAHPHLAGDPDNPIGVGADLAGRVLEAAQGAEQDPDAVVAHIDTLERWVRAHARKFPHIDWGYVLELAGETAAAAVKLAA